MATIHIWQGLFFLLKKHFIYSIFLDVKKVLFQIVCWTDSTGDKQGISVKPSYSIPKIITKLVLCEQLNNNIRGKKVMISYMTTLTDIPAEFDWLIIATSKL